MRFTQYLTSLRFEFERYKKLGDVTFSQLSEPELYWQPHGDGNSVALIVKHMVGNMKSRWTNFLTEDGEKPWRHRETEFEQPPKTKEGYNLSLARRLGLPFCGHRSSGGTQSR